METNLIRKKMVICGATGINNSGDEAILDVVIQQYASEYDITVISLNDNNASVYHPGIPMIHLSNKNAYIAAMKSCDVFLLGGGGLFQDETSIFNIMRWYSVLKDAVTYAKKTMVYANSIGPLKYGYSRRQVKKILNQVDCITLRDSQSYALLQELGVTAPFYLTADPVFSYQLTNETATASDTAQLPERYVAIAIRHWYDTIPFIPVSISKKLHLHTKMHDQYIDNLRRIVTYINAEWKLPVAFLSFLTDRDRAVAEQILNTTELRDANIMLGDKNTQILPKDMFPVIQNAELLIGMRLHSLIYATDVCCPFIAIDYSSKVTGILKDLKMSDYAIPVDDLSVTLLEEKYQLLTANRDVIIQTLQEEGNRMRQQEQQNSQLLRNL